MPVAEGDEVVECLLSGHRVVARDRREVEPGGGRVDEHDGQVALGELGVVPVGSVLLGVHAAGEHDAGHLLVEQQVDVRRFGEPTDRARAQHRGEAVLGERSADDVGDRREDRVLQFGQDEPDEAGPLAAQLRRALVAEHVERREHRLAGRLGDPGTLVEHPADRRLADADVSSYLGKPPDAPPQLYDISPQVLANRTRAVLGGLRSISGSGRRSVRFPGPTPPSSALERSRASSVTRKVMTRASSRQAS